MRHFFLQDDYLGNGVNEQDNVENPWWVGSVSSTPMAMFGRLNGGPDPTICQIWSETSPMHLHLAFRIVP